MRQDLIDDRALRDARHHPQRVVRLSKQPVLVVNLPPSTPYRRPLLATDLGPSASRVAEFGIRLINRSSVKLMVLHAWDIPFRGWLTTSDLSPEWMPSIRERRDEALRDITTFVTSLEPLGVQAIPLIRRGNPRFVVLDEVKRRKPDLAVVGTHGLSGLPRTILITVAETLVADAECDVLVVQ